MAKTRVQSSQIAASSVNRSCSDSNLSLSTPYRRCSNEHRTSPPTQQSYTRTLFDKTKMMARCLLLAAALGVATAAPGQGCYDMSDHTCAKTAATCSPYACTATGKVWNSASAATSCPADKSCANGDMTPVMDTAVSYLHLRPYIYRL